MNEFFTVEHNLLIQRLSHSFEIKDRALNWLQSYTLMDVHTILPFVKGGDATQTGHLCVTGVPQGSVLVVSSQLCAMRMCASRQIEGQVHTRKHAWSAHTKLIRHL